jgi:hypothetical protein
MASFTKFDDFVAALAHKVHNLGSDQLCVALSSVVPDHANTQLADLTEIAYTNLSTREITTTSSTQATGTYKLILTDLLLTATGAVETFRYVSIYNDTAANKELIAWFDYGSNVTLANGETFNVTFDAVEGLLQLA